MCLPPCSFVHRDRVGLSGEATRSSQMWSDALRALVVPTRGEDGFMLAGGVYVNYLCDSKEDAMLRVMASAKVGFASAVPAWRNLTNQPSGCVVPLSGETRGSATENSGQLVAPHGLFLSVRPSHTRCQDQRRPRRLRPKATTPQAFALSSKCCAFVCTPRVNHSGARW